MWTVYVFYHVLNNETYSTNWFLFILLFIKYLNNKKHNTITFYSEYRVSRNKAEICNIPYVCGYVSMQELSNLPH